MELDAETNFPSWSPDEIADRLLTRMGERRREERARGVTLVGPHRDDLVLTLAALPEDGDYATWGPLVEDDLAATADAATQVEQAIAPSCSPASTDAPSATSA